MEIAIEIIGWIGAALVLAAYAFLSTGRVDARSPSYQAMNIAGAVALIVNSGWNHALPSATVNVIWAGIGVYALAASRLRAV